MQSIGDVIVGEARISEPVSGGAMQHEQPAAERNRRRDKPSSTKKIAPPQQHKKGDERDNNSGFLHEHKTNRPQRRPGVFLFDKQEQHEKAKHHRGHVQLGHHALRVEQRRDQQQKRRKKRRRALRFTAQLNRQQKSKKQTEARHEQHGHARYRYGEAEELVPGSEISLHARRMNIGDCGARDPSALTEQVESGRDELPVLIPEEGQRKKLHVDREQRNGK